MMLEDMFIEVVENNETGSVDAEVLSDYSKIELKPKTYFESVKLVYQEKIMTKSGNAKALFNVYELGETGLENPPLYLLTRSSVRLRNVNQFLAVTPITNVGELTEIRLTGFTNHRILDRIRKKYGFPSKIDEDKYWKDLSTHEKWSYLFERHLRRTNRSTPIFLKLVAALTKTEENEVEKWDFNELEHDFLYDGLTKDPDIIYIYRGQLIDFENNPLRKPDTCQRVQPYNSHAIISSLTKRGKTTTGEKVMGEEVYDEASKARIKGYATADKVFHGDAHMRHGAMVFDNTQNAEVGFFGHCLELAEKGVTKIGKGSQTIITRFTAAIIFHANPPHVKDSKVLAKSFVSFIKQMTISTAGPVGSRFAFIGFFPTEDTAMATGDPLESETTKKNKLVFYDYILKRVNQEVRRNIFPDKRVRQWLNKRLFSYAKQIKKFIVPLMPTIEQAIVEFWIDHGEGAFRHLRGAALKEACMDNQKEIFNKNYSVTKILQDAEIHVEKICNLNIKSLQHMLETIDKIPREEWILSKYNEITYKKAKAAVLAVAVFVKRNAQKAEKGHSVALEVIAEDYNELPNEKKIESYPYLSNVAHNLPSHLDSFNNKLGDFGFTIIRTTDQNIPTVYFNRDSTRNDSELQILAKQLLEEL